jgi:hypothetical protein
MVFAFCFLLMEDFCAAYDCSVASIAVQPEEVELLDTESVRPLYANTTAAPAAAAASTRNDSNDDHVEVDDDDTDDWKRAIFPTLHCSDPGTSVESKLDNQQVTITFTAIECKIGNRKYRCDLLSPFCNLTNSNNKFYEVIS